MKVFVVLCLVAGALGSLEPAGYQPPSNRYIPANRQNNAEPSQRSQYLPPNFERRSSNQYNSQASTFGASQKNLDNRYLAPFNSQQNSIQGSARDYLAPAIDRASSSQFKPYSSAASSSSSSFSSPSYQSSPSSPSSPSFSHTSYSAPSSASTFPSNSYSSAANSYSSPFNSYVTPLHGFNRMATGSPSSQYLSPNAKQAYSIGRDYQEESEPANYNFEYQVKDEFGNDFGHKESRQDEKSYGIYSVLLPDGRKQVVEYEADEEGFRPRISYEEIGGGFKNVKSHNQEGPY